MNYRKAEGARGWLLNQPSGQRSTAKDVGIMFSPGAEFWSGAPSAMKTTEVIPAPGGRRREIQTLLQTTASRE